MRFFEKRLPPYHIMPPREYKQENKLIIFNSITSRYNFLNHLTSTICKYSDDHTKISSSILIKYDVCEIRARDRHFTPGAKLK